MPDPTQFWFFDDRAAALSSVTGVHADVLALHERLLGRDVPGCIAATGDEPRLDRISARFVGRLAAGRGRVVATMNGLAGDSGMESSAYYLLLRGASRRRLVASDTGNRAAFASRAVVRAVRRPTLVDGSFCMSAFLGLDQRETLPPFFPVLRNSDGIFGVAVRRTVADAVLGLLPWVLAHDPREAPRAADAEIGRAMARMRMCDLVIASLQSCPFGPGETPTEDRMRTLGRHLIAIGRLARADYDRVVARWRWRKLGALAIALEQRLSAYGDGAAPWAKDVATSLETLQDALRDDAAVAPADLIGDRDRDEALALSQRLFRRYGELLDAWPALVSAARRLRDRGEGLAVPCS